MKILIIATPYDAEMMRKTLGSAGYQSVVTSRKDAPETVEQAVPALVLISVRKSQVDTKEVIATIRGGQHGKKVPLVLISEPAGPITAIHEAVALGADHLLLRPLDLEQLVQSMNTLLADTSGAGTPPEAKAVPEITDERCSTPGAITEAKGEVEVDAHQQRAPDDQQETAEMAPGDSALVAVSGDSALVAVSGDSALVAVSDEKEISAEVLPRQGDLSDLEFPRLLYQAHHEGLTGKLILRRGESTKVVFFDDGDPVFATSEQPHDRMGAFLRRQGKITDIQYAELQRTMSRTDERLGTILVRRGFIKPRELFPLVRDHVAEIIYSLFSWSEGEYLIDDTDELIKERIKLESPPVALILEGVRRKYGMQRLRPLVGPPQEKLRAHPQTGVRASEYGFREIEVRTLEQLDGERTLGQLAEASPLEELGVYQLCYVALLVGLARRDGEQPGRVVGAPPVGSPRESALDRRRILSKYAQVCEGTYFNLLGVPSDVSGHEVLRAYEHMRTAFALESIAPEVAQEYAQQISEINEVIEEAFRVLVNDPLREAYRRSIT